MDGGTPYNCNDGMGSEEEKLRNDIFRMRNCMNCKHYELSSRMDIITPCMVCRKVSDNYNGFVCWVARNK